MLQFCMTFHKDERTLQWQHKDDLVAQELKREIST